MGSSYKGIDLFGSGPHRFAEGRRGLVTVSELGDVPPGSGSRWIGLGEVVVTVRGRLIASSEVALWGLRDAIVAQVTEPPVAGVLVDRAGRQWLDMSFIRFTVADRVDRGRVISVGYSARFVRFRV